ncbi:hypothetical protein VPHK479_0111 [Vibrio phage K479]
MYILFEWALREGPHLKFLFKVVNPEQVYQIPKFMGTKIANQRPMHITLSPNFTKNYETYNDVWKCMSQTAHPRGTVSENQQWIDKAMTEALLGIIPTGDADVYRLWLHKMRLEHDANYRAKSAKEI